MNENDTHRPIIFVSHTWQDMDETNIVVEYLKSVGYEVWWDFESLKDGGDLWFQIMRCINVCDAFIVLLSESALKSEGVQQEISWAHYRLVTPNSKGKKLKVLLPIKVKNCNFEDDLRLSSRLWINALEWNDEIRFRIANALPETSNDSYQPNFDNLNGKPDISDIPELTDFEKYSVEALHIINLAKSKDNEKEDLNNILNIYKKALDKAAAVDNKTILLDIEFEIGVLYAKHNYFNEAVHHFEIARQYATKLGKIFRQAEVELQIADVLMCCGETDNIDYCLDNAKELFDRLCFENDKVMELDNIVEKKLNSSEYNEALSSLSEILRIKESLGESDFAGLICQRMAYIYKFFLNNLNEALKYAESALNHFHKIGEPGYIEETRELIKEIKLEITHQDRS